MDPRRKSALAAVLANGYNLNVERDRSAEYPQLTGCTYLDHGGATLYPKSGVESFAADLCANLFGNPHSMSASSQLSTKRTEDVRLRVLKYFNADPEKFDVVFCANATAGIKLVLEGFSALKAGFRYKYHGDAHTSLIGVRELSTTTQCFVSEAQVEQWLEGRSAEPDIGLFAWPGQSNLTGRRHPVSWAGKLRAAYPNYYSLFDAAALLMTSPLDLSDAATAPDFTVLSFYKIFGLPDLGALIVRKDSNSILARRKYFGGGTVDALTIGSKFVARKQEVPHDFLEDGTIPFHSIVALGAMMTAHERLYGSPATTSKHALSLAKLARDMLSSLKHGNGRSVCKLYGGQDYSDPTTQGPTVAFNMQKADGSWVGYAEVEKLATVKNIHIRVGGMCNPGGMDAHVGLKPWEIEQNYAAGHVCSDDHDIMNGKPTGAIRISMGAMSTVDDVLTFVKFVEDFYVDKDAVRIDPEKASHAQTESIVESLTIYPIKSCSGFKIPAGIPWEIRPHGLAWDREWCLIHLGTGAALSQKAYNRMAMLRPEVNLETGILTVRVHDSPHTPSLRIPLHATPSALQNLKACASRVCGDKIMALTYSAPDVVEFFSSAVGVPCTLARLPAESSRNFKPHLATSSKKGFQRIRKSKEPKILLSNESPILIVNRSSVNKLNEEIEATGGKQAKPDVFRANIVLKDTDETKVKIPYAEDGWSFVKIGKEFFELLGPCRRCHMVCIDQDTAEKNEEPFVTLTKTRRVDGKIFFGQHAAHLPMEGSESGVPVIQVGDRVQVWGKEQQPEVEVRKIDLAGPETKKSGGFFKAMVAMVPRAFRV
ncbi:pyridoxal phosphate-dependent transferase [Sphaerosporella brunnea]|uniref:Molybdenum cofactor sulfurase n=1 Tax=Sphaerosporella brunnea TaxID=1250544 RepID=A0A5J5EDM6_9PEZI|nr:pyridoxal phosphate-dependent transferase [Sphaerosporella brunnea]